MSLSSSFLVLQASHTFGAGNVKRSLVSLLPEEQQVAFVNNSKGRSQTRAAIVLYDPRFCLLYKNRTPHS